MPIKVKDGQHYQLAKTQRKRFVRLTGIPQISRATEIEPNDEMTVEVRFSSDQEVEMWYGTEVLIHTPEAMDLTDFNSGKCPVMKDHRWSSDYQIAVVVSARIEDGFGIATLKFSNSQQGTEYYNDVIRGIRDNVSVGYDVHEWEIKDADKKESHYIATKWTPREISFVPFPADKSVGPIRSERSDILFQLPGDVSHHYDGDRTTSQTGDPMPPEDKTQNRGQGEPTPEPTPEPAAEPTGEPTGGEPTGGARVVPSNTDGDKNYNARMILALCTQLDQLDTERGVRAIADGQTFEEFQADVIEEFVNVDVDENGSITPDESVRYDGLDVAEKDRKNFRLLNLIAGEASKDSANDKLGADEREICNAEREKLTAAGIRTEGYPIPGSIVGSAAQFKARKTALQNIVHRAIGHPNASPSEMKDIVRALVAGTDTAGGHLVDEILLVEQFLDILYANHPVSGAVTWMNDIQGTLAIPKQNGRVVAQWATETGTAAESEPSFELIQMSPKELRVQVPWSLTFAIQSSIEVENFARRAVMRELGEKADELLLYGQSQNTPDTNEPRGVVTIGAIKNSPNSQRFSYDKTDGASFEDCLEPIATVGQNNAMMASAQWITSWGFWKMTRAKSQLENGDMHVWDDMNMIGGFPAVQTSQVRQVEGSDTDSDQAFFATWEYQLVPQWGGIDIIIDPYTKAGSGQTRLVAFMRIDSAFAYDEAFTQMRRTP